MKKKLDYISILAIILICGVLLEDHFLSSKSTFMLPLTIVLFTLTILFLVISVYEYVATKDRKILKLRGILFIMFFLGLGLNLIKIFHQ